MILYSYIIDRRSMGDNLVFGKPKPMVTEVFG